MHTKKCSKCGEEKPIIEFHKSKRGKYGVHSLCKICDSIKRKKYSESRPGYDKNRKKEYYYSNKEIEHQRHKTWVEKNREHIRNWAKEYDKSRCKNDEKYKLKKIIRGRIHRGFDTYSKSGKTKSCKEYGIDFDAIFNHIGPRPDKSYHLDHIIPLSLFDLDNPEHVRLAHLPENLRWLPGKENLEKHDKIILSLIEENPILLNIFEIIKGISK